VVLLSPFGFGKDNNRSHRRILVMDGRVGFTRGVGVSDKWLGNGRTEGYWRQQMSASRVHRLLGAPSLRRSSGRGQKSHFVPKRDTRAGRGVSATMFPTRSAPQVSRLNPSDRLSDHLGVSLTRVLAGMILAAAGSRCSRTPVTWSEEIRDEPGRKPVANSTMPTGIVFVYSSAEPHPAARLHVEEVCGQFLYPRLFRADRPIGDTMLGRRWMDAAGLGSTPDERMQPRSLPPS
jgi:hypothetical protein